MSLVCALALVSPVHAAQAASEFTVPGAPDKVRAWLADHERSVRLSPDVVSAEVVGQDGACALLDVTTRGVVDTFSYRIKRCPTASGYREEVVSSSMFASNTASWQVVPTAEGSQVTFSLDVKLKTQMVPEWLLTRSMQSSVDSIVDRVRAVFRR
jgi:carbon monoxide dehydrogenase subunit G